MINPRLHSGGYFPFSGALLNHNPVADVNFFYSGKRFGAFLFQSVDLADRSSYVNYMQPGIFVNFEPGTHVRLRGFFGYIFSQTQGFCDPESDYYVAGQLNWQLPNGLRIENTLLFYDYTYNKKLANRFLLEWADEKVRVSVYLWHRIVIDEQFNTASASVALTFPIIKLSKKANLEFTSAYLGYLTENKPDFALRDGFLFTLAVPLSIAE